MVNVYAALLVEESEQMQMVKPTRLNKIKFTVSSDSHAADWSQVLLHWD